MIIGTGQNTLILIVHTKNKVVALLLAHRKIKNRYLEGGCLVLFAFLDIYNGHWGKNVCQQALGATNFLLSWMEIFQWKNEHGGQAKMYVSRPWSHSKASLKKEVCRTMILTMSCSVTSSSYFPLFIQQSAVNRCTSFFFEAGQHNPLGMLKISRFLCVLY